MPDLQHIQHRLTVVGTGVAFVAACLLVLHELLTQGINVGSAVFCLVVLMPFIVAGVFAGRDSWIGCLLGMLTISTVVPLPVLSRVTPGLLMAVLILIVGTVLWMGNPVRVSPFRTVAAKSMMIVALGITARILWDRPGSALVGSTGGAGQAILYCVGGLSFLTMSLAASQTWNIGRNVRVMAVLAAGSLVLNVATATVVPSEIGVMSSVFTLPGWLLAPLLLAKIHQEFHRRPYLPTLGIYLLVVMGVMAFAAMTPFRSRPYFGLAIVLVVAMAYAQLRRAVLAIVVVGLIGGAVLMFAVPESIPLTTRRALSTVSHVDPSGMLGDGKMSSEVGWQSAFRATLARRAWENIKTHPLTGKGFSFSGDDLVRAANALGSDGMDARQMSLVISGGYHNTLLALAVFCGVPLTVLFITGTLVIVYRFYRKTVGVANSSGRLFAVSLLGFFAAVAGQTLMNGDGGMFLVMCTCVGIMNGMLVRWNGEGSVNDSVTRQKSVSVVEGEKMTGLGTGSSQHVCGAVNRHGQQIAVARRS